MSRNKEEEEEEKRPHASEKRSSSGTRKKESGFEPSPRASPTAAPRTHGNCGTGADRRPRDFA
eukprot:4628590-Prymnesium_polylepis.1